MLYTVCPDSVWRKELVMILKVASSDQKSFKSQMLLNILLLVLMVG